MGIMFVREGPSNWRNNSGVFWRGSETLNYYINLIYLFITVEQYFSTQLWSWLLMIFLLKFFIFCTASMFYFASCDKNGGKCCYSRLPTVGGERSDASCCHVRKLDGNVTDVAKAGCWWKGAFWLILAQNNSLPRQSREQAALESGWTNSFGSRTTLAGWSRKTTWWLSRREGSRYFR